MHVNVVGCDQRMPRWGNFVVYIFFIRNNFVRSSASLVHIIKIASTASKAKYSTTDLYKKRYFVYLRGMSGK